MVQKNENDIRLRGMSAINAFAHTNSASRLQMQSNAFSQHLVIEGVETNSILTGFEQELGKHSYSIKAPDDIIIEAIIDKYVPTNLNGIKFNPQTIVIYRLYSNSNIRKYGILNIPAVSDNHPKFGFPYVKTENANRLRPGSSIRKDTILFDTPAKDELGNYGYGTELLTLYSTLEGTCEDSILISKAVTSKLKTKLYVNQEVSFGENNYPLNLYGDDDVYRVFPDIGDYIVPPSGYNGLIMATREFKPDILPITFTKKNLQKFNPISDKPLYASAKGGRIIDITVYRQSKNNNSSLSDQVYSQLNKYADAYVDFCKKILNEYKRIMITTNNKAEFTDEFDQLIKTAMAICEEPLSGETNSSYIQKVGNFNVKLDDWVVKFTVELEKTPLPGFKVTDISH